jgi:hypothetical protein
MGECALEGPDSTIWGSSDERKSHKPDLVALRPRAREDPVSKWAAETTIFNLFKCGCARYLKRSRKHGSISYTDSTIYRITYWITVILAALIPIASIAVLNEIQAMPMRLGTIAAFNVLLSICLIGFADAKRDQVFAINAAYVYPNSAETTKKVTKIHQLCRGTSGLRRPRQMFHTLIVAMVLMICAEHIQQKWCMRCYLRNTQHCSRRELISIVVHQHLPLHLRVNSLV